MKINITWLICSRKCRDIGIEGEGPHLDETILAPCRQHLAIGP